MVGAEKALEEAAGAGRTEGVVHFNHVFHEQINAAACSHRLTALLRQTVEYTPRRFLAPEWWTAGSRPRSTITRDH